MIEIEEHLLRRSRDGLKVLTRNRLFTLLFMWFLFVAMFGFLVGTIKPVYATTIFSDGFETNNFSAWTGTDVSAGTMATSSAQANSGTYSAVSTQSALRSWSCVYYNSGTSYTNLNIRCYMYVTALPASGQLHIPIGLYNQASGTVAESVYDSGNSKWGVWRGGNFYWQSGTSTLSLNTWICIELYCKVSTSSGVLTLWINGNVIVNQTSLNTGSTSINQFVAGNGYEDYTSAQLTFYVDDVVVSNTYIGPTGLGYNSLGVSTPVAELSNTFSVYVMDNSYSLSTYVFGTNETGIFTNQTGSFDSTPQWVNITKTNNATIGYVITYEFWFNDSNGAWLSTGLQSFMTIGTISAANAPSASISTPNYLSENIVYDNVTNLYWWCFTDFTTTYQNIRVAYSTTPTGSWTVQSTPIVASSAPNSKVDAACLVQFGSYWYVYYANGTGTSSSNYKIYVQKSSYVNQSFSGSGISNPVLTNGVSGQWDSQRVSEPFVLEVGSTYYMFFMGQNGTSPNDSSSYELLGYATSSSPTSGFSKYGENPITPANVIHGDNYDGGGCKGADPWVIKIGSTYYVGVTVSSAGAGTSYPYTTVLYSTTDFLTFTYYGFLLGASGSTNWDARGAFRGAVSLLNGTYYFAYTGGDNSGNPRMGETTLKVLSAETRPPTFGSMTANTTVAGAGVSLSCTISDDVSVSSYTYSWNNTGSWANQTAVSASGPFVTATLSGTWNSTSGNTVSVKVYANDTSNKWNVSSQHDFTIIPASASGLVFAAGGGQSLTAGQLSGQVTVQRLDQYGNPATSGSLTVNLSSTSVGAAFYSDAGTTQATSVTISDGSSTISFWYNDTAAGSPTLTVSSTGLTQATTTFTITASSASRLAFTVGVGQSLVAGQLSKQVTVQRLDQYGNPVMADSVTVDLTSTSLGAVFYSDSAGTIPVSSVTIGDGLSTVSFWYRDTVTDSPTLTASAASLSSAITTFVIEPGVSFSVISNSTVSGLAFNSASQLLEFTVSGPSGTFGFANVTIAKTLISDVSSLKVYLNETEVDYVINDLTYSWLIHFTYHHSTQKIILNFVSQQIKTSVAPLNGVAVATIGVAVVIFTTIAITIKRARKKT